MHIKLGRGLPHDCTFADVKCLNDRGAGKIRPGGTVFEARHHQVYMALGDIPTQWNAVNLETGDLAKLDDFEPVRRIQDAAAFDLLSVPKPLTTTTLDPVTVT